MGEGQNEGEGAPKPGKRRLARSLVLVGLMGAGKTSVGKRLAARLGVGFRDSDDEIELAANSTVAEIFENHGEQYFREGERRVIARLIDEEPRVIATGGGAFINDETRGLINDRAVSIWLRADLETLAERTSRKSHRPLLAGGDPEKILAGLMDARYPIYAEARITVDSKGGEPHAMMVERVLNTMQSAGLTVWAEDERWKD